MEITEKKNKRKKYKPILGKVSEWPVYQLSRDSKNFLEEVSQYTMARIQEMCPVPKDLTKELEFTVYREQNRIKHNLWKVDPIDDKRFWSQMKKELINNTSSGDAHDVDQKELLERIVNRYTKEIAGRFRPSAYRFARRVVTFWFIRLLNGARVKKIGSFFSRKYTLRDKIQIVGEVKNLRRLARKGTIVITPTHFSNLDSILIGWVINELGLPAFIYGAGLNLFNIKILAYFMNSLGAYKVDRRRKNMIYLETLKSYSTLAIMKGAHSLFFPGGTRSRSGAIEKSLKLGLLNSVVEAQRNLYLATPPNRRARKLFIVPVTFNTHFVLEAPDLIEQYLQSKGQEHYLSEDDKHGSIQMLRFIIKFLTKGSNISVSIGKGMDVFGNYLDKHGRSIDKDKAIINTKKYFVFDSKVNVNTQREATYTRMLSERIVEEYYRIHRIFSSHVVAFVAFNMWKKEYAMLDLFNLLRLSEEELELDFGKFRETFKRIIKVIIRLQKEKKLSVASHLKRPTNQTIILGLNNVGTFHLKRPLLKNKKGNIITQDITLLYYYHNRLTGYDLEQYI